MENRTVRIAGTDMQAIFTQRGRIPTRGFVRVNGFTVAGDRHDSLMGESVFWPHGRNAEVVHELGW